MPMARVSVTANTEPQLRTKTWPEVQKWLAMLICRHWFSATATKVESADPTKAVGWRADALPWSAENTEAFAGLHNQGRRIVLIMDEASAIDDRVWEVAEGAMTDADTEIVWAVFGNPTRTEGRLRDCFGRFAHRWDHRAIDARQVEGTNKAQLAQWVEDWGEDADFVRVRVRGMFPRAAIAQFIPTDMAEDAASPRREVYRDRTAPLVMGVDCARGGDAGFGHPVSSGSRRAKHRAGEAEDAGHGHFCDHDSGACAPASGRCDLRGWRRRRRRGGRSGSPDDEHSGDGGVVRR